MTRLLVPFVLLIPACEKPASVPSMSASSDIRFEVPAFSFTERSGKTVTNADLKGKVWVASFVFTRCNGPCPAVTATVAKLAATLPAHEYLRFVTFTIDPERDGLADLKQYAERYRAGDNWLFLTGPEKSMHEFATSGFKLLAKKSETPKPGEEFDHSSKLAVVDRNGIIRGYFDGMEQPGQAEQFAKSQENLKEFISRLLKE